MNEEETFVDEIEVEDETETPEVEAEMPEPEVTNPLADFVGSVEDGNYVNAQQQFDHAISDRLQQTLDQAKMAIAGKLYNAEQEIETEAPETES